jgi:hypothetical protein
MLRRTNFPLMIAVALEMMQKESFRPSHFPFPDPMYGRISLLLFEVKKSSSHKRKLRGFLKDS